MPQLITFDALPLCIGAQPVPHNPEGLPDVYPFALGIDERTGVVQQQHSPALERLLRRVYGLGVEIGTPSADSRAGQPYVTAFLDFVLAQTAGRGRALEIGAGVGYLSALLARHGWATVSVEPGAGYAPRWAEYGVEVINDFFPTPLAPGPYDLIVFHTVLEHVAEPAAFLQAVADHLAPAGTIVLAVPDCSDEIACGDPSMLLHEHYQYFTAATLRRVLEAAGWTARVQPSPYGRSLFAAATRGPMTGEPPAPDLSAARTYPDKLRALTRRLERQLDEALGRGTLGVYCPARALALLPPGAPVRFFDDAPELRGKYYPPFDAAVESRADLLANPPDQIWIMSRTFGAALRSRLQVDLPTTSMALVTELAGGR